MRDQRSSAGLRERQAWPFLTFCNNETTPPTETRLCIDAEWSVAGADNLIDLMLLEVNDVPFAMATFTSN